MSMSLTSCSDDIDTPEQTSNSVHSSVVTSFSISLEVPSTLAARSSVSTTGSANGSTYSDYRGRTVNEDLITTAVVFLVPVDNDIEDWADAQAFSMNLNDMERSVDGANVVFTMTFSESVTTGKKHVYAAANLTGDLITEFIKGAGTFRGPDLVSDDYDKMIHRFVNAETGAIAMSGDSYAVLNVGALSGDGQGNDGTPGKPYRLGTFNMQRMVAKILFTCATTDSSDKYAVIDAQIDSKYKDAGLTGWMRMSSVRFKLGTTNRTTYLTQQHTDDSGLPNYDSQVIDPNYHNADILKYEDAEFDYVFKHANDFTFYHEDELYNFLPLISSNPDENPPKPGAESNSMAALPYYERRIPGAVSGLSASEQANVYATGLYCLENTTDNDWSFITDFLPSTFNDRRGWFNAPRRLATNIIIETQYTPAVIVGEDCMEPIEGYTAADPMNWGVYEMISAWAESVKLTPYCFTDGSSTLKNEPTISGNTAEERARQFLISESEAPELKQPTFYALYLNQNYVFFTYRAAQKFATLVKSAAAAHGTTIKEFPYNTYTDGLGYYQTYLNQVKAVSELNPLSDAYIEDILRNTYYILGAKSFSVPATHENGMRTISFGCSWIDWVKSGTYEDSNVSPTQ
jgi:hypothetical protein